MVIKGRRQMTRCGRWAVASIAVPLIGIVGGNMLLAMFAEREAHATFFLQEQGLTRFDVQQYLSNWIIRRFASPWQGLS
jgi:hypothetical protein